MQALNDYLLMNEIHSRGGFLGTQKTGAAQEESGKASSKNL